MRKYNVTLNSILVIVFVFLIRSVADSLLEFLLSIECCKVRSFFIIKIVVMSMTVNGKQQYHNITIHPW